MNKNVSNMLPELKEGIQVKILDNFDSQKEKKWRKGVILKRYNYHIDVGFPYLKSSGMYRTSYNVIDFLVDSKKKVECEILGGNGKWKKMLT